MQSEIFPLRKFSAICEIYQDCVHIHSKCDPAVKNLNKDMHNSQDAFS